MTNVVCLIHDIRLFDDAQKYKCLTKLSQTPDTIMIKHLFHNPSKKNAVYQRPEELEIPKDAPQGTWIKNTRSPKMP